MPYEAEKLELTWYVAQLKPNGLELARRNVSAQGFRPLCPQIMMTRRSRFGLRTGPRPLFPGYMFVGVPTGADRLSRLNHTRGILRILTDGQGRYAKVPGRVMSVLREQIGCDEMINAATELTSGDSVEVIRGPFTGWLARVLETPEAHRVWLFVEMMGRELRLEIDRSALLRA